VITPTAPVVELPAEPRSVGRSPGTRGDTAPQRPDPQERSRKLQQLLQQAAELRDPVARALVHECFQSLLSFYGDGLARLMEVVHACGPAGETFLEELIKEPTIRALLLIHGLHPLPLETRLRQAVERIRPYMESHGGNVELLSLENDFARLRLQGSCKSCPSSSVTMELALRHAIEDLCPDLLGFEVEGASQTPPQTGPATNGAERPRPKGSATWTVLDNLPKLEDGQAVAIQAGGVSLVLSRLNGDWYAYRNACPDCASPLETTLLNHGQIRCPQGHRYDIRLAGRAADERPAHLDPFPLLLEDGVLKIAVN
jgi:Fe-S cluster biogenesis protein NfuA/nitrite reductase/ring-hydroxylating ferredoxin subunit